MVPRFYYNDRFRLGTLSGSNATVVNPVERVSDGFVGLSYAATSGTTPSGQVQVTLSEADLPHSLVIGKAEALSGYRLILESEDVGGGGNAVRVDETVASAVESVVFAISGGSTARRVWRLTMSGVSGLDPLKLYEAMLADLQLMPRSNSVGVERTRVRQYTRTPVPGGQAFVVREGPPLRRTRYSFVVVSGAEVSGLESFVDGIDGGESFFHVDDRAEQYMAELLNKDQPFNDSAGVFSVDMTVQEVA